MDLNALRELFCFRAYTASASCICRFGKLPGEPLQPDPDENPENAPEYCKCGCCVAMPTQLENKCCTQTRQPCITLALSSHS